MAGMDGLDAMRVSDEKKKYIVDLLNPTLEALVAECIKSEPGDPVAFMLEWLENKRVADDDGRLSSEERNALIAENEKLEADMKKVKSEMQETVKLVEQSGADESEEEDEDEEPPPDFYKDLTQNKARASVSAEAYGEWNTKKAFVPPVITKTDEQKERLRNVLVKSFLFNTLDDNDFTVVIGAMSEVNAAEGEIVIKQGDQGDFLFVIETGKLDCVITVDGNEKVVKTCEAGDVFGELALLYNCPRAATVRATEACVLWKLDRDTFNSIVKDGAQKKRQRYDTFLAKVPLLSNMDAYERSQLADALKIENFVDGAIIFKQGDVGNKFYIIEEGSAVATKAGQQVMTYAAGDYFGELALLRNQPRAASVTAKGSAKLLSIDSRSFKRLLNVSDLMDRATKYT
jgi:cAMP-dependent protein kinase regulator